MVDEKVLLNPVPLVAPRTSESEAIDPVEALDYRIGQSSSTCGTYSVVRMPQSIGLALPSVSFAS
uniref:Uncharacterized protein n=1 Tax=Anopheles dirus TaxID=7168 RepID=A0A182NWP4_9DIPT